MSTFSNIFKTTFINLLSVSPFETYLADVKVAALERAVRRVLAEYIPSNLIDTIKLEIRHEKMTPETWAAFDGKPALGKIDNYSIKDAVLMQLSVDYMKTTTASIGDCYSYHIRKAIAEIINMHIPEAIAGYINFDIRPDTLIDWSKYIHSNNSQSWAWL